MSSIRHCEQCGAPLQNEGGRVGCWSCLLLGGEGEKGAAGRPGDGPRVYQHYQILQRNDGSLWELGRGAMGVTYKAMDRNLHTIVALKVINTRFSSEPGARRRFLREARAAARLSHPNVAIVFHFGEIPSVAVTDANDTTQPGDCFYAMEFIEGETLEALLRRDGVLDFEFALEIGVQVSSALAVAEKRRLIHCDLKPSNIMLLAGEAAPDKQEKPLVKIIDFGLAKAVSNAQEDSPLPLSTFGGWKGATGFVGTPRFASPEQLNGEELDVRSDIFSLGATLWHAVTGEIPFDGESLAEIRERQVGHALPLEHLDKVKAPAGVISLLSSMLAADRAGRPASAQALQESLQECLDGLRTKDGATSGAVSKEDPEALRLFRCAQGVIRSNFEIQARYEEAIGFLEQALVLDPKFVAAYGRLAEMHALMFRHSYDRSRARADRARDAAHNALRVGPKTSEAHRSLGIYEHHVRFDYAQARQELTQALKIRPNDAENLYWLGLTECRQNLWEEGLACFQKAAQLEPYRLDYSNQWWRTLADLRRYDQARAVLDDLIVQRPEDIQLHVNRAYLSYSESADLQPLRDILARVPPGYDPDGYVTFLRNGLARYDNDPDEAERILAASPFQQFRGFIDGQIFPRSSLDFLNALLRGDMEKTRALAAAGRPGMVAYVQALPDAPELLMVLASYDAILGRREEAVDEGRRALAMLPVEKDGVDGPKLGVQLSWVYFHLGDFEEGLELLRVFARFPGATTYGDMKLGDVFRPARHHPGFLAFLENYQNS